MSNVVDFSRSKAEANKTEATINLKIGGKYDYEVDGQTYMVMVVDVDTHIAVVDFNFGTPIKTVKCLNSDKEEALKECQASLRGQIVREIPIVFLS